MANIQSEGSRIRLQPGTNVDLVIHIPNPQALYSVLPPPGVQLQETISGLTRTFHFRAPSAPWSGTFIFAFAFIPNATGGFDPGERFKLAVDDPATGAVDLDISTIRPRPGNPNPIPFVLDFIS